jgi:hypothetical protein
VPRPLSFGAVSADRWLDFTDYKHELKPGALIISEFYSLRRTVIKDIASYLGFLSGFIGSAPFAWGLLADQLDRGNFARGLWYFFGIVTAAGIFAGIAGLGIGMVAGMIWEQIHRHRRREKSQGAALSDVVSETSGPPTASADGIDDAPRLKLVTSSRPEKGASASATPRRRSASDSDR